MEEAEEGHSTTGTKERHIPVDARCHILCDDNMGLQPAYPTVACIQIAKGKAYFKQAPSCVVKKTLILKFFLALVCVVVMCGALVAFKYYMSRRRNHNQDDEYHD